MTTGGAETLSSVASEYLAIALCVGWTNAKGLARRPTRNDSEKFNVASVARAMPRISNENDFVSW